MSVEDELVAAITAELATTEVQLELHHLADQVCDQVKAETPVFGEMGLDEHRKAPPEGEPGDAREAVHIEPHGDGYRIISRNHLAVMIEIGGEHMPEYAPFTKAAAMFGSTDGPSFSSSGRDSMADHGVQHAHENLRSAVETYAKLRATGAAAHHVAAARKNVAAARIARSAAFNAARPRRGRR